jgi:BON domain
MRPILGPAQEPKVKVMNIKGDVTLAGTVPSYPQYLQAAAAARRVAGVSGVHNNLMVVLPDSNYRDDVLRRPLPTASWPVVSKMVNRQDGGSTADDPRVERHSHHQLDGADLEDPAMGDRSSA